MSLPLLYILKDQINFYNYGIQDFFHIPILEKLYKQLETLKFPEKTEENEGETETKSPKKKKKKKKKFDAYQWYNSSQNPEIVEILNESIENVSFLSNINILFFSN